MRLGFDARMLFGKWRHRGIGGYILTLLKPLNDKYILSFLPRNQEIDDYLCIPKGISFFPIWEQILLPYYMYKHKLNIFLFPSITAPIFTFSKIKKIFVVYDLIFLIPFKELQPSRSVSNNLGRIYRRILFPLLIKSAKNIICISEFTKTELNTKFNISLENINVIPCSITNDWFVTKIIPSYAREKYFISVTGDVPSKNLNNLLLSFSIIKKINKLNGFKLRLVGIQNSSKKKILKKINSLNLNNEVIIEEFLLTSDLQNLYQKSWASLTLSLYEGFGVPVIESMASGTPVICSNTTSLPEVSGGCSILVNPRSIDEIIYAIINMINASEVTRNKMSDDGFNNALKYSETNVSNTIIDFWKNYFF